MNAIVSKIPFVKTIFMITKEIVLAFANTGGRKVFKKPVLTPFPSKISNAIGFETGKVPKECQKHVKEPLKPIFIPTAPHPISGYLVMAKESRIHELKMSNEAAIKLTVSCGVIVPEDEEQKK